MENMKYEDALKRLDEIIHLLESNQTDLDKSIELYEEGMKLSLYCDQKLKSIENKVTKIFEDNQLKDFED